MSTSVRLATPRLFGTSSTLVLLLGNAIGGVCIAVNWWRAGDSGDLDANLSAADLAVIGIVIAVVANGLWYLTARGALGRRRRLLSSRVNAWGVALDASERPTLGASAATSQPSTEILRLVAVPGGSLYHRYDCSLVANKRTVATPQNPREGESLQPCGVCEPHLSLAQIGAER